MNRYGAARVVLAGIRILAWVIGGITLLVAWSLFFDEGLGVALGLAGAAFLGALITLALVEMASAQLDTADSTARMVALLERLSERDGALAPAVVPGGVSPPPQGGVGELIKTYKGFRILREPVGVSVEGAPFNNVLSAERWIDAQRRGA